MHFFAVFLSLVLLGFLAPGAQADTITIVADQWCPFNCSPNGDRQGYMIDVAREIFKEDGHQVVYRNVPWKRALMETKTGRHNAVVGASRTDAAGFVFPDEELARNYLAFYVRKGSAWRFTGPDALSGVLLGVCAGYDYRQWLNDYIANHAGSKKRVYVMHGDYPLQNNLRMLVAERIDAVVDTELSILGTAKKLGLIERIELAGYGKEPAYIYIAFSPALKSSTMYARTLSAGIARLRSSGRLAQILDAYGLKDWK